VGYAISCGQVQKYFRARYFLDGYTEALDIHRALAKDNPAVFRPYVANTLNNLAVLVMADSQRRIEAEELYIEALDIRRAQAKDRPAGVPTIRGDDSRQPCHLGDG